MIDRKNFDLADAVILLEIYLNGKAQGKTLHEMAQQASEWMRVYAIAQGNEISASYRSVSGLTERLSCLRHIIEQDDIKAKPASRMFLEAIELRRSNSERYNEIRDALLKQSAVGVEPTYQSIGVPENTAGLPNGATDCEEQSESQITVGRKEFDLKDASILLDLYIKGQQRGATLREIAEEASQIYRFLALQQGIDVTPSYRPVDGLYGRLKSLQITYEGVEIKGKKPTRVFEEAVALYRTNPKVFERIRNEALGTTNESAEPVKALKESDGSVSTQSERQEQFYTWLSEQVSRTMLSDIYTCAADLDAFCISKKLSKASVFEITDSKEIRKIRTALDSNRIFKFTHRKQCKQMLMLLQHYEHFLQEELPRQTVDKEEGMETAIDLMPVDAAPEIESVPSIPQKNSIASVTPTDFQKYLISHGKSVNEAWRMISIVESLRGILQSNYHHDSLYAITDANEMTSINLELLSDHRFVVLDKQHNNLCSAVILAYRSMLEKGSSITTQQISSSNDQADASQIKSTSKEMSAQESGDIIRLVKFNRLTYVDKRQQGGVLWLIGGMELANFVLQASKRGFHFKYCPGGGRSTEHRTAWYLVEEGQNSEQKAKEDRASAPTSKVYTPLESEVHINIDQDKKEETPVVIPSVTPQAQTTFDDVQRVDNPQNRLLSPLQETRQQEVIVSDLSRSNNLAYCSFDFIELEGIRYSASATWRGAYVWAMNALLRNHSEQFREILDKERSARDYSSATCKLENGAIIGINYSATELMKRLSSAATICDIPAKDVLIGYRPTDGSKARISAPPPKQDTVKTSLAAGASFAYCKPVSCSMNGVTLNNAMFWQRVHLWILISWHCKSQTILKKLWVRCLAVRAISATLAI